ncbi:MAG: PilZ domain-containing protein [Acidobacteriia bacterium]|nr:PilZ domain-containing protein [Terriglobia bacterium]
MESRPETRVRADILVRVWGMGADGHPFFQNARADNISSGGALLTGIEHQLTAGDIIGVQYGDKKARFRVVWAIDGGILHKIQVGIELLDGQNCPWRAELSQPAAPAVAGGHNKRKFVRHKITFPIDIRDERGGGSHMQTSATDISGRGCYVETLLPLPLGTAVEITFWMESEKIHTAGMVRASDPGVGMGIEFVGLDDVTQQRFQRLIERLDTGVTGVSGLGGGPPTTA